jgi:transposase
VIWRPGKGWVPHWREEARSLPGRPRRPDGAVLTDRAGAAVAPSVGLPPSLRSNSGVISHPDCRSTSTLIAARQTRPVDFRKGVDGLAALVRDSMGDDPFSGTVYVFRAKRADRVKLVFWDGTGVCLFAKRLEEGQFRWPKVEDGVVRLTATELQALLDGLDWTRVRAPRQVTVPAVPS